MPSIIIQPPTSQVESVSPFDHEKRSKRASSSLLFTQDHLKTEIYPTLLQQQQGLNGGDYEEDDLLVKMLVSLHQQQKPVIDESGLHLVSLSTERILLHLEDLITVESLRQELWELGKRLKQSTSNTDDMIYVRAIQVMIYHCRGSIRYSERDWIRVVNDCRKCLAIDLPTSTLMTSDSLLLQKVGLLQEHAASMLEQGLQYRRPFPSSGSSSSVASRTSSSGSSSSLPKSMVCSFCSVEKRAMPVCAQCKIQTYCGISCLKQDKARHSTECQRQH